LSTLAFNPIKSSIGTSAGVSDLVLNMFEHPF
jgi:hypothetical protein